MFILHQSATVFMHTCFFLFLRESNVQQLESLNLGSKGVDQSLMTSGTSDLKPNKINVACPYCEIKCAHMYLNNCTIII